MSGRLKRYLVVSRDLSRKRNLARFRKAQKILALPDDELYEALQRAISDDPNILDDYDNHICKLLESSKTERTGYLDFFRFLADLDHTKADDVIDYLSPGEPNFATYDNKSLEFEDQINHVSLTHEFEEWHNRYFVIEGFTALVKAKIAPPAWMLKRWRKDFQSIFKIPIRSYLRNNLDWQERQAESLIRMQNTSG